MAFNPLPVDIPPGMWRNGTYYQAMGKWWQGDMVRWENNRIKPIGGWVNILLPDATFTGYITTGTDNQGNTTYILTVVSMTNTQQILPGMTITYGGNTAVLALPNQDTSVPPVAGTGTGLTGTYYLVPTPAPVTAGTGGTLTGTITTGTDSHGATTYILTVSAVTTGEIVPGSTITYGDNTATLALPNQDTSTPPVSGTGTGATGTYYLVPSPSPVTTGSTTIVASTAITATNKFQGVPRGMLTAEADSGEGLIFVGTNTHLYWGTGGLFQDITPIGFVPGGSDAIFSNGYGAGLYNTGDYGVPQTSGGFTAQPATWAFDNYGQNVVMCCTSDKHLYMWLTDQSEIGTETAPGVVTGQGMPLENSPTMISVFVTNENYIMGLATQGVGRQIQWPDLDDVTDWTAASTNSAGSLPLNTEGVCMSGARVGTINLIWTNVDVHQLNFIGTPGIYGVTRLAGGCGLVSPNAWAVTDTAYWWSPGGFYYYNGVVKPLDCPVQDIIFRTVDQTQYDKVYAEVNSRFNEMTWFFPSTQADGSLGENDSYVTYNYKYGYWYYAIGSILGKRTCWADRGVFPNPMACSPDGILYDHEVGYLADGVSRIGQVYIQSGPIETGGGQATMGVDLLMPDVDPAPTSIDLNVQTQFTPDGPVTATEFGPITPNSEGYFPVRFTGRQFAVKYTGTTDADWSSGTLRFNAKKLGSR